MSLEKCPACGSEDDQQLLQGLENWTPDWLGVTARELMKMAAKRLRETLPSLSSCTPANTRVGAVVRLNSGGPDMTVEGWDAGKRMVSVVWATEHGRFGGVYSIASLSLVKEAPQP